MNNAELLQELGNRLGTSNIEERVRKQIQDVKDEFDENTFCLEERLKDCSNSVVVGRLTFDAIRREGGTTHCTDKWFEICTEGVKPDFYEVNDIVDEINEVIREYNIAFREVVMLEMLLD
jgi:hypothetical protein